MKVAVSSTGKDLDSQVDPRFGRCAYFIIVETDDMSFETVNNENIDLSGGAGIQSASFLGSKNVSVVLTGACGPNAMKTLSAGGIEVYTDQKGIVRDIVEKFKQGGQKPAAEVNASEETGASDLLSGKNDRLRSGEGRMGGAGRGMGRGRGLGGGGRCMGGRGRGLGMGRSAGNSTASFFSSQGESLNRLKKQATFLQKQMEEIQDKIKNLEKS